MMEYNRRQLVGSGWIIHSYSLILIKNTLYKCLNLAKRSIQK